jgi:hypothetical protein
VYNFSGKHPTEIVKLREIGVDGENIKTGLRDIENEEFWVYRPTTKPFFGYDIE